LTANKVTRAIFTTVQVAVAHIVWNHFPIVLNRMKHTHSCINNRKAQSDPQSWTSVPSADRVLSAQDKSVSISIVNCLNISLMSENISVRCCAVTIIQCSAEQNTHTSSVRLKFVCECATVSKLNLYQLSYRNAENIKLPDYYSSSLYTLNF